MEKAEAELKEHEDRMEDRCFQIMLHGDVVATTTSPLVSKPSRKRKASNEAAGFEEVVEEEGLEDSPQSETIANMEPTTTPSPKKRGRPPKVHSQSKTIAGKAPPTTTPSPKKNGRSPKVQSQSKTIAGKAPPTPSPKKRGRPPGKVHSQSKTIAEKVPKRSK